jgi:hypothetical protein
MGHHNMLINNLTELQEGATKPSYCSKSQRDVPPSKFKASEPMLVPYSNSNSNSNSRKDQVSSFMDGMEHMYDSLTWQMYFRIMSARKQASLARVLAGEAEHTSPEHVFSRVDVDVDVNEIQDQATSPIAFQAIPSKSRNITNHRHAQNTHVPPRRLVSDTTSEEDFLGDSYHEGEVFTLDI